MLEKNNEIIVNINDLNEDGYGVGRTEDGTVLFVRDALPGEQVRALVLKVKKTYGYAKTLEILSLSKDRVNPPCPAFFKCGGCSLMHFSYMSQLEFKKNKVLEAICRIGGFNREEIQRALKPVLGMDEPYHFRNKSQYPIAAGPEGGVVAGFYAMHSHRVVENEGCLIGQQEDETILRILTAWMEEFKIRPYDEKSHRGLIRHALIRKALSTKEVMLCLVINGEIIRDTETLYKRLRDALPGFVGLSVNVNKLKGNVILGDTTKVLFGKDHITDVQNGLKFRISPASFYQVNTLQTNRLYGKALEYADLSGREIVWDLYCGIGTITLNLAKKAGRVLGIEIVPSAVEDAKENAGENGVENAEFFCGKAEEVLKSPESFGALLWPEVIVLDPPRAGCEPRVLSSILQAAPKRIVYVSCNPATLARDLKTLCEETYEIQEITPVDQFCHSTHVESVVLLTKVHN